MKSIILIISIIFIIACGISEPLVDEIEHVTFTVEKRDNSKTVVCHKTSANKYNRIEISENAVESHLNHGDGFPGEEVPDQTGFFFDDNCGCIEQGCPETVYYDGKLYHSVQIGDQCWLKENLDIGIQINGNQDQTDNDNIEKFCYDDIASNCENYGGLYQWDEAMQYVSVEGNRGICPDGWHIPTKGEFETLIAHVGNDSRKLKEVGEGMPGGIGTNESGFSALMAGYRDVNGRFVYFENCHFWTSNEYSSTHSYFILLRGYTSYVEIGAYDKPNGFSIRCIKD